MSYQYAIDNGFAVRCEARGITDQAQVQGLMKVAHKMVADANQYIKKEAMKKQALSDKELSMLVGGLGGAGLGAGIGGLAGGWEGAGIGALAGGGLGAAGGLGYDALRGGEVTSFVPRTVPMQGTQERTLGDDYVVNTADIADYLGVTPKTEQAAQDVQTGAQAGLPGLAAQDVQTGAQAGLPGLAAQGIQAAEAAQAAQGSNLNLEDVIEKAKKR